MHILDFHGSGTILSHWKETISRIRRKQTLSSARSPDNGNVGEGLKLHGA